MGSEPWATTSKTDGLRNVCEVKDCESPIEPIPYQIQVREHALNPSIAVEQSTSVKEQWKK